MTPTPVDAVNVFSAIVTLISPVIVDFVRQPSWRTQTTVLVSMLVVFVIWNIVTALFGLWHFPYTYDDAQVLLALWVLQQATYRSGLVGVSDTK